MNEIQIVVEKKLSVMKKIRVGEKPGRTGS